MSSGTWADSLRNKPDQFMKIILRSLEERRNWLVMAHTGHAFDPWTVTNGNVDDWKTFVKDETRTYTGVFLEVEVSWDQVMFRPRPTTWTNSFAFQ